MYAVIFIIVIVILALYLMYSFRNKWKFLLATLFSLLFIFLGFLGFLNAGIKADENVSLSTYDNYITPLFLIVGIILLFLLLFKAYK
jgi:heme A synthase